jgi:capsular exopolysaccharide synthesis family protein
MSVPSSILDEERIWPAQAERVDPMAEETLVEKALRVLRNRWWVALQAIVVIPIAALVLSLLQDESWTSTSRLLFEPARQSSGVVDLSRQSATQTELVGLPAVAEAAADALGAGWTGAKVEDAVEVDSTGDTNIVDVNATTPDPRTAAMIANAYAGAFVKLQDEANVADARRRLQVLDDYVASLPLAEREGPRGVRLAQRIDALRISQASRSNDQRPSAQLVQPAQVPTSPSSPKTGRNVALGLLAGILLGIALAGLLERLDRAIKSGDELERIYGVPVLGRVPKVRGLGKRLRQNGAAEVLRKGVEAEAFRALRSSLRYFDVDGKLRSLLLVSPEAQDGKSTVAACLATTYALRGERVVLVETDLHKRAEHRRSRDAGTSPAEAVGAGARHELGLSTVLVGGRLDEALRSVPLSSGDGEVRELTVLPSGPTPPNPSQLLESRRMGELMHELARRYDMVVYDSPAMGAVSDALALVPEVGGVVVVSRLNHTSRDSARELVKQLALLRANVLGLVANYAESPRRRGYDYYGA